MVINSENSATHGPHQVAQILMSLNLSELFFTSSFIPASSIISSETGSLAHSSFAFASQFSFSAHLMEQPNTFVVCTGTSLPASNASIALRVSKLVGVFVGF